MTRRPPRARALAPRAGLTLAEVLVAILIMGIGLVSVASLFPIGLLRVRDATRNQRTVLLMKSAAGEIEARNLFNKLSFTYSWYQLIAQNAQSPTPNDPWVNEVLLNTINANQPGMNIMAPPPSANNPNPPYGMGGMGPGLPVAYDPLWWSTLDQTNAGNMNPLTALQAGNPSLEGRFGVGIDLNGNTTLRADPLGGSTPSGHGLQRITNFLPYSYPATLGYPWDFTYPDLNVPQAPDVSGEVFASPDDIVFQKVGVGASTPTGDSLHSGVGSPIIPDLSVNILQTPNGPIYRTSNSWTYSWMFTGYQVDVRDWSTFAGSVVLFHNRPIGLVHTPLPNGSTLTTAADERVVEAIFGYSSSIDFSAGYNIGGTPVGYGAGDQRIVLVRWPSWQEDPKGLAAGNYIADTTYERYSQLWITKFSSYGTPGQRCNWYRIAKAGPAEIDPDLGPGYRRKILTLATPVRSRTMLQMVNGHTDAAFVNVATVNPYVVNVVTKVFYAR